MDSDLEQGSSSMRGAGLEQGGELEQGLELGRGSSLRQGAGLEQRANFEQDIDLERDANLEQGVLLLSTDSLMREMAHLNAVIERNARNDGGAWGPQRILAILAGHEVAIEEGFARRLMSQVEVAQVVGIRPQSVGALISQLEESGFVERVLCEGDRRAHLVALTDEGRESAKVDRERQCLFAEKTLACLTVEEKNQLTRIVLKLNEALS